MSKICPTCGKELADSAQFCDNCGTSFVNQQNGSQSAPNTQQNAQGGYQAAEVYSPEDIEKNKVMAGLAYLIFFLPLIACPDSRYARFHANQALLVFLLGLAAGVINIIPILGCVVSVIAYVFTIVLIIMGMVNAFGGKAKELPLIGKIKIIK
ncbi:MAG: zinc-ribbon domain-containing protein [Eubacteriales bacterium]|nr:zinc-ribbon domain-containing protein [Eubacteriales bacterium]